MKIVEIFVSRQGEGIWTGTKSTFIRVSGCNLRCSFCDTRYASWEMESGGDLSPEELTGLALLYGVSHVVLTGGEPMLFPELVLLTRLLSQRNFTITIETNGTIDLPVTCDLMSISPKMGNSTPDGPLNLRHCHEQNRFRPEVVQNLISRYPSQLKFVVDTPDDLQEIDRYLQQIGPVPPERVLLMPQAVNSEEMRKKSEWILRCCRERGFLYSPRMHLEWYGGVRRK